MKVFSFHTNSPLNNYNHYILSEDNKSLFVFDPLDLDFILSQTKKIQIENYYLLNTHNHYDHISQNQVFLKIKNSKHLKLKEGESFDISSKDSIISIHTPGHQPDHYCYVLKCNNENIGLISGDTIFAAGVGNCKDNGNIDDLYDSILKISHLEDKVIIYPSHDYFLNNLNFALTIEPKNLDAIQVRDKIVKGSSFFTSIELEKKINPFFRTELIKQLPSFHGMTSREVFTKIRLMRDKW